MSSARHILISKMLKVKKFKKFYSAVSRKGKINRIKIKCDTPINININHSLVEKNLQTSHKVKQKLKIQVWLKILQPKMCL